MKTLLNIRYALIGLIVLILVAFGGWYFFIQAKQAEVASIDAARGAGLAPSFASKVGSTYENIVSSLAASLTSERASQGGGAAPQLSQVNKTPTAGAGFVTSGLSDQGTSTSLRFVERSTGYVFDVDLATRTLKRVTGTLLPRTYEALVAGNGRMIMRGIDENDAVATIAASVTMSTTSAAVGTTGDTLMQLAQTPLSHGTRSIVMSPSGEEIFYIAEGAEGGVGIKATWDGEKPKQVFSSAIVGWQAYWLSGDRIVLMQKPSDGVTGYAYELGKDGALAPLALGAGLTVLPHPTSTALIYGTSAGGLSLFVRVSKDTSDAPLPIRTIADKCVWSSAENNIAYCAVPQGAPPSGFLDRWHRGETHTADAWWRVDASAASAEIVLSPGNASFDVERPIIDESGRYIAFMNATDKSLWLLRIEK